MAITQMSDPLHGIESPPRGAAVPAEQDVQQHISWLLAQSRSGAAKPHHYLLLLRFALVNILAFALLGAAFLQGWIDKMMAGDRTYLSVVIFMVFLGGLVACAWRIWQTSRELNQVKSFDPLKPSPVVDYIAKLRGRSSETRSMFASTLRLRLSQRISLVRHVAGSLVLLGLVGTVIGFIIALSGVDPESAADVKSIAPMVSTMIEGMSTALYTTLVGSVLNLWLMVNYRLLAGGTTKLITSLIEFGEDYARA